MIHSSPVQILIGIVEDERLCSQALESMLFLSPEFKLGGVWRDAGSAIREIPAIAPDIVLIDICLQDMNGIDCIREVKKINPRIQFLVFTGHEEDDEKLFDAFKAGAAGYLLKRDGPELLIKSIRELLAGGAPMSLRIARRLINFFNWPAPRTTNNFKLTCREEEVLSLLAEGKMYKEVAILLAITMETVKKHTRHIYHKLQVQNRTEAVNKWRLCYSDRTMDS